MMGTPCKIQGGRLLHLLGGIEEQPFSRQLQIEQVLFYCPTNRVLQR